MKFSLGCFMLSACDKMGITRLVDTDYRIIQRGYIEFSSEDPKAQLKASYISYNRETEQNENKKDVEILLSNGRALLGGDELRALVDIFHVVAYDNPNNVDSSYKKVVRNEELEKANSLKVENLSDKPVKYSYPSGSDSVPETTYTIEAHTIQEKLQFPVF